MNILLLAGEPSGDLHASLLIEAIQERQDLQFWGTGGDNCSTLGMEIIEHVRELAVMGFWEVLPKIFWFKSLEKKIVAMAKNRKPAACILVDYPGFNLSIAPKLKALGIPVIYFISPQLWAWKESRVKKVKKHVDLMLTILPFEKEFYAKHGLDVDFVGHPFLDIVRADEDESSFRKHNNLGYSKYILLLPGSRKQEFLRHMPILTAVFDEVSQKYPEFKWRLLLSPNISSILFTEMIDNREIEPIVGTNYSAMTYAEFGLITSGSATLEAGVAGMPHFVIYKTSAITYHIAKKLVKIQRIGLVNLVNGETIAREFIQKEANSHLIAGELEKLLSSPDDMIRLREKYVGLKSKLGEPNAAQRAAELVLAKIAISNQS